MLGNEIVLTLIDTGNTVSLIREDVSSKIVDHSRLSKINTVLYDLGQTEVITEGSFDEVTTSPKEGATSEYMYPSGMTGFSGENECDAERDRREGRDSDFTDEKPRFSFNVEAN
ncbi:hypothetical protein TNCV_4917871 [Trichonephila clavipes]|nr:hypothetical protein TNCV_4917871 [Trichonephila clavipes]